MTADTIKEILAESEKRTAEASPGPWRKCSAHGGKCSCTMIYSIPADAPILDATSGKWGDEYPALRFVENEGPGCIGAKVEAYIEMIEYGEIPEAHFQANKEFVAHARTDIPARDAALRVAVAALEECAEQARRHIGCDDLQTIALVRILEILQPT